MKQPQEIEVWYVLPSIRKKLAVYLIKDHKLSQKKVAEILAVTEPAISQYLGDKRASQVDLGPKMEEEVRKAAKAICKNPASAFKEIQRLSQKVKKTELLCTIHKRFDSGLGECRICFKR